MLTNRYLEYSEDITEEMFDKIFYIISQYGYKPLFSKDILWEEFKSRNFLTYGPNVYEYKSFCAYTRECIQDKDIPITVEEILDTYKEELLRPFNSFKGGIKVREEDLELIKEFLLFLCPENPSRMSFNTINGNIYYLCIENGITLSIKCETYCNRETIGPILNIYDAISSYVRDGYSLPEEFFKSLEKNTEKLLKEAIEEVFSKNKVNSMDSMFTERPLIQDFFMSPLPKSEDIISYKIDKDKFFPEILEIL